jgi:VIT1/CCC1 family predicted Fe2+/Mn2+ transporter
MNHHTDERSIGDLFTELSHEVSQLVKQEIALLRLEMSAKAGHFSQAAIYFAAAGLIAYAGFLALTGAAVFALWLFMPGWLAALIVALVWGGVSYFLVQRGMSLIEDVDLTPHKTVATLKEITRGQPDEYRTAA